MGSGITELLLCLDFNVTFDYVLAIPQWHPDVTGSTKLFKSVNSLKYPQTNGIIFLLPNYTGNR